LPGAARRRGQILVEFALIALVLYLLLAAIIDFGRATYSAQGIQQAVDVAARELSRMNLPPTGTLTGPNGILGPGGAGASIYQEKYLIVDLDKDLQPGQSLDNYFSNKPVLNQMLYPLMIFEERNGQRLVHYPGQLVPDTTQTNGFGSVRIPIVQYTPGTSLSNPGTDQIISYIPVVEEITSDPNNDPFNPTASFSPFNLLATSLPPSQRGLIALRINYPFQAAALSAYTQGPNGGSIPITTSEGGDLGPYGGDSGLGVQSALATKVRPFRRVLSAQAIFRREIFE
jgi:hypothetical protein